MELHGSVLRNYCERCLQFVSAEEILNSTGVPKCPKCGGLMVHKMGHGGGFDACIAEGCGYTTKQNKQDKKGSEE